MDPESLMGLAGATGMTSLLPTAAGLYGQQQTNTSNSNIADMTNQTNLALQAQGEAYNSQQVAQQEQYQTSSIDAQEAYQTQMSDTSYQRGVAGLKAAGLNPIMAQMNGGASTPSGASSSGAAAQAIMPQITKPDYKSPWSSVASGLGDVFPKVLSMMQSSAEIKNTQANTDLANAQAAKTAVDTDVSKNSAREGGAVSEVMGDVQTLYRKAKNAFMSGVQDVKDNGFFPSEYETTPSTRLETQP